MIRTSEAVSKSAILKSCFKLLSIFTGEYKALIQWCSSLNLFLLSKIPFSKIFFEELHIHVHIQQGIYIYI